MQRASQSYFQTQVTTTGQGDIVIMLYDAAIKFLQQAQEKIELKDPAGKGMMISKALDVINELDCTLNIEKGGDLAQNLHELYYFCNTRLLMANLKMDVKIIDEIIKVLSGLRSAFAQIKNQPEAMSAAQQAADNLKLEGTNSYRAQSGVTTGTIAQPVTPASTIRRQQVYAKQQAVLEISVPSDSSPNSLSLQVNPSNARTGQTTEQPIQPFSSRLDQTSASQSEKKSEATSSEGEPSSFENQFGANRGANGTNTYKRFTAYQSTPQR